MAANLVQASYRVPAVFRAARTRSWIKRGEVTHLAFYRRDSDTDGLSVGDTPEVADQLVREHFGIIQIPVDAVRALRLENDSPQIRLDVQPDAVTADKGIINTSLPFRDDPSPDQAGLAIAIAKALATIATPTAHPPKVKAQ